MVGEFETRLRAVDQTVLTPPVRRSLGSDMVEVVDWNYQPVHGGLAQKIGHSYGIYRFSGNARVQEETVPWSLILKAVGASSEVGSDDPVFVYYLLYGWGVYKFYG